MNVSSKTESDAHLVITLLGWSMTAAMLASVRSLAAAREFRIDRTHWLTAETRADAGPADSGPADAGPADSGPADSGPANACVEFAAVGPSALEAVLRSDLSALADKFSIDIACQRESLFRRSRRLVAFDMDSTLIQGEVIDELAKLAGVGTQVAAITEAAMRGELDFDASFTRRVSLLKGLRAEQVYSLLDAIPLAVGAERLFRTLKLLGLKTAILSGGFTFFARSLQERFRIDHVHANELEIVDGLVTGRVIPPIVNGRRKAALLSEIAAAEGLSLEQVVAVGDGANDIPMLNAAGMGIAYRAKPKVREQADHSITQLGLDGILYLIGVRDSDLRDSDRLEHERQNGTQWPGNLP
jgi:phosphoserine phosphatase